MNDPLDTLLAAYAAAEPGPALRQRIIAAAPRQRTIGLARRWLAGAGLGAGLAAAGAAGVAAGFALAPDGVARIIAEPSRSGDDISSRADPAGDAANG